MLDDTGRPDDRQTATPIDQLFFRSRNVVIGGEITDKLAQRTVTHLLALAEAGDDPINPFVSSPGGHVESGDMVHDAIKVIRPRVRAIGSGRVASAGALIFVGADGADRYCLPNTRFLLHEPAGGIGGQATDRMIRAEQIRIMRGRFHHLFAEATGEPRAHRRRHGPRLLADPRRGARITGWWARSSPRSTYRADCGQRSGWVFSIMPSSRPSKAASKAFRRL